LSSISNSIHNTYLYFYGLWPEVKLIYYLIVLLLIPIHYILWYWMPTIKNTFQEFLDINFFILIKKIPQVIFNTISPMLLFVLLGSYLFAIIMFSLTLVLNDFLKRHVEIIETLVTLIFVPIITISVFILAIVLVIAGVYIISLYICDSHLLRKLVRNEYLTRGDIEQQLKVYKTPWGRMEYINFLWNQNIRPTGNWTTNLPNYKDEASSLLARLEEKWLGLDR